MNVAAVDLIRCICICHIIALILTDLLHGETIKCLGSSSAVSDSSTLISVCWPHTVLTLSALWLWCQCGSRGKGDFGRLVCLYGSRQGWRWNVFEGLEVVDDVVSNECAPAEGPPINYSDTERRMEVFILWQLLQDNKTE